MSYGYNPCCGNPPYPQIGYTPNCGCNPQIPACQPLLPVQTPVPQQIESLTTSLYGPPQLQVINGRPVQVLTCAFKQVGLYAMNPGEGLLCYILRLLQYIIGGAAPGGFAVQLFSLVDLKNVPTANGQKVGGYSVVPAMNVINPNMMAFFLLVQGGTGIQPNDYNSSTNNVSWLHVL